MKPARRYPGRFAGPSQAVRLQCAANLAKASTFNWAEQAMARYHAAKEAKK